MPFAKATDCTGTILSVLSLTRRRARPRVALALPALPRGRPDLGPVGERRERRRRRRVLLTAASGPSPVPDLHADLVRHVHRSEDEEVRLSPLRKAAAALVRDGRDEAAAPAAERIVGAVVEAEAPFLLR